MTDPKPEPVDLDALERRLDKRAGHCSVVESADVLALITELRAARSELADREHLEEGARLLTKRLKVSGALGIAEIDWEEAERIRKAKVAT